MNWFQRFSHPELQLEKIEGPHDYKSFYQGAYKHKKVSFIVDDHYEPETHTRRLIVTLDGFPPLTLDTAPLFVQLMESVFQEVQEGYRLKELLGAATFSLWFDARSVKRLKRAYHLAPTQSDLQSILSGLSVKPGILFETIYETKAA